MIGMIAQRFFHAGKASMAASSVLAKLRKSTGYSVSNCKKALEMFPNDIKKAEEWLHSEAKSKGWSKWASIQNRIAAQGLIGICTQGKVGVMVEVNCETDFVARNAEFQQFVEKMLSGCINYAENLNVESDISKAVLEDTQLSAVKCESSTLGELLITAAFKFNEKTVAKRAVCLKAKEDIFLSSLSHPVTECPNLKGAILGKYGVLLALKKTKADIADDVDSLGCNVCQHIIGMNPLSIGELTEKDIENFNKNVPLEDALNTDNTQSEQTLNIDNIQSAQILNTDNTQSAQILNTNNNTQSEQNPQKESDNDSDDSDSEEHENIDKKLKDLNEARLLFQPYLLDSDVTVGELLFKSGLEVVAFERFECGEIVEEIAQPPEVAQSVGA